MPLLATLAVGLVGWTLYLTYALPAHHVTQIIEDEGKVTGIANRTQQ